MMPHGTHIRRVSARSDDLARMAMRAAARLALTILVAFHAWLLWTHLVGGKALEPQIAVRWIVAAVVLVGFRALQRRGMSLFWGKRAVVLWLLVVVIHCHAVWSGEPTTVELGVPETITLLAQLTAPATTVVGLFFLGLFAALMTRWAAARRDDEAPARFAGLPASDYVFRFSPRPPPVL
jgi:hypothetical protein